MKLKTKTFTEDVFDNTYYVVIGDEEEAEKFLKKKIKGYKGDSIQGAYAIALHIETLTHRGNAIYFSEKAWNDKEYRHDTIAHEALHATIRSLMQHGIKFEEDNHELFCYTLGWIVRNIYKIK